MSLSKEHPIETDDSLILSSFVFSEFSDKIKPLRLTSSQSLVTSKHISHHPQSGLNPLVDAASRLFSLLGQVKQSAEPMILNKLHDDLIQEMTSFYDAALSHGYSAEYTIVCRFAICATFDDILENTLTWCDHKKWAPYSLLTKFSPAKEKIHDEKFFSLMKLIVKNPKRYIDLMELLYLCLSMGYLGPYRKHMSGMNQVEQIASHLYQHIRAYRGNFSKFLSPTELKIPKIIIKRPQKSRFSLSLTILITLSVIMVVFISLSYLMDIISNEAYTLDSETSAKPSHQIIE